MKDRDGSSAMELSDGPTLVVGAQGTGEISRRALGVMLEQSTWQLLSYEIEDLIVREAGPGVVITAYKVTEKVTAEEEPCMLEAYDSSVWVKHDSTGCAPFTRRAWPEIR